MAKSIEELCLHPVATAAMRWFFEGEGSSDSASSDRIFELLDAAIARVPAQQVHRAGLDILKVAQALSHIGRFVHAEALADGLRRAVERRARHEGRIGARSEHTELAGEAYAELTDRRSPQTEAPRPIRRPAPAACLPKHGLEEMDLDALRRLAARADQALRTRN